MKLKSKYGNLGLGAAAILGGIVIVILTKVQKLEFLKKGMPGAGMFPILCGIAIAVCGALLIFEVLKDMKKAAHAGEADADLEENLLNVREIKNMLLFLALGAMILLLSEYIGLLTCLCISVIAYIKIQGKDPWWKAIVIGICMTVFLYFVFVWFLRVPVPKGPLGF